MYAFFYLINIKNKVFYIPKSSNFAPGLTKRHLIN